MQQQGRFSHAALTDDQAGGPLRCQELCKIGLQRHAVVLPFHPDGVQRIRLLQIPQRGIDPKQLLHTPLAVLPQGPVGDSHTIDPVQQLLKRLPHLANGLVSPLCQGMQTLFQDPAHHADHRLGGIV